MKKLIAAVFAVALSLAFGVPAAQAAESSGVYVSHGQSVKLTNVAWHRRYYRHRWHRWHR